MASRGHAGGLARATMRVVNVLDALGTGLVIVETVGVGQEEVEVVRVADTVCLVTVPGLGDDIQAIKAGVLEIADVLVVNKADKPGADEAARDLAQMLTLGHGRTQWKPPIVRTSAQDGSGVDELVRAIDAHAEWARTSGELEDAPGRRGAPGGRGAAARRAREAARVAHRLRARVRGREARREARARSVPRGRGAARHMTIELTIFRTGAVKLARSNFAPWLAAPERDEFVECPVWSALLRTPEGLIVFDTGPASGARRAARGDVRREPVDADHDDRRGRDRRRGSRRWA